MTKQPFYLFKRKLPSGKSVYYFYTYDRLGNRTTPKSTGFTRKQDAVAYCVKYVQRGVLDGQRIKYGDYADGFFDDDSEYVKERSFVRPFKKSTLKSHRAQLKYSLEYFGQYYLDEITTYELKKFRQCLIEEHQFSASSVNMILGMMRLVMGYAEEQQKIIKTPFVKSFGQLSVGKVREAFKEEEIFELLGKPWKFKKYWLYALTAAITGMRSSEIAGLQYEQIKDTYIDVDRQYKLGEITTTKTKVSRFVTIPEKLRDMLLSQPNSTFFIFPGENIEAPIAENTILRQMYNEYSDEMRKTQKERRLTLHSFRYFVNTYLMQHNIHEKKVDFMLGHSSGKGSMNDLYTTWRPEMYKDILDLQTELLEKILKTVPVDWLKS